MTPTRYAHPLIVLHWLLAVLIFLALFMGSVFLESMPNSSPDKINALRWHMITGIVIGLLMIVRLVFRLRTQHPPKASTGIALADRLAPLAHWALYLLVFAMVASGIGMSVLADLPAVVFGGTGSLPESFDALLPRVVHGIVAKLLLLTVVLHIAAALYHQFVVKDRLLSRMGLGRS